MFKHPLLSLFVVYITASYSLQAQTYEDQLQDCLFETIKTADKKQTLQKIENDCEQKIIKEKLNAKELGALSERMINERKSSFNPHVITPHRMNYILPISATNHINRDAYIGTSTWSESLKDIETKFQLSIKVPLTGGNIFTTGDQFYMGFTLTSWWQVYTEDISRPFRETNYQPEFFYFTPTKWHPFDTNTGFALGFEHQSNGRSQLLSRSWNRVYANFIFEKNNFVFSLRPWYRLSEDEKSTSIDAVGDDNPDIDDYMGHFELTAAYKWYKKYEVSVMLRENFAQHNGAIEVGITFPLWGKLRGYAQYFNGYGESLIDYNHKQQRFGIGVALTDLL